MLVDKGHYAGASPVVVGLAIMAAAVLLPDFFKGSGYFFDAVGEQAGKAEVAKGLEELDLGRA
tara:strand:- start:282 stop:470 length:189 start_codon:yes stop_codon:yes gene_type:complete